MSGCRIAGLGHYVPERVVSSAEIEDRLGLTGGWIERRTGIRERRYAGENQAVTDLALEAARRALADAGAGSDGVDLVLLATSTPDHLLPPSAPLLAQELGASGAGAVDLAGACSGFIYALAFADGLVRTRRQNVLVVAANVLSRRIDPDDRASGVLFADGAGAVLLVPCDDGGRGVVGVSLTSNGALYDAIKIEAGGSRMPFTAHTPIQSTKMKIGGGRAVFTAVIESMVKTSRAALADAGLGVGDISFWVPHQANARLIEAARKQLGISADRTLGSILDFGNSSAATIPLTLSKRFQGGGLRTGDVLLLTGVGAGFTEGSVVFRC